ncbi:hypothetical protein WJX79_000101 [Trebouxia sp. C0005]
MLRRLGAIGTMLWVGMLNVITLEYATASECETLRRPNFPHCSPVKYYSHPEDGPVTVVLLNFKRSDNIRKIVDNMVNYNSVAEIIVVSNNPNSTFTYPNKKEGHCSACVLAFSLKQQNLYVTILLNVCD